MGKKGAAKKGLQLGRRRNAANICSGWGECQHKSSHQTGTAISSFVLAFCTVTTTLKKCNVGIALSVGPDYYGQTNMEFSS